MRGRQCGHIAVGPQRNELFVGLQQTLRDDARVSAVVCSHQPQLQILGGGDRLEQGGNARNVQRSHQPEGQHRAFRRGPEQFQRRIRLVDDAPGDGVKHLGRGGRRHALLVTDEQRGAELRLEAGDGGRDRRLGNEAASRRRRQVAFLVDRHEVSELADIHRVRL